MSQLVQQNESDATLRRLYFYLVDATDGITPETGDGAGQPQISVDGAAFTNTGIGTLTHMGNGQYYGVVTQATINVTSAFINGRFKSAATAEAPSLNILHVVEWDPQATPKTVADRLGAFTGTGVNTILGFFRALFRKDGSNPSDVGGTFDAGTDAVEALRERLDAMAGGGFSTAADSLDAISGAIAGSGAGGAGGASGIGGTVGTATTRAGGFLNTIIGHVRKATDEPAINAKYTDTEIIGLISDSWAQLWQDLNLTAEAPLVVRQNFTLSEGQLTLTLPSMVGEIIRIARMDGDTDLPIWEFFPQSYYNPGGPGISLEGNVIRFGPAYPGGAGTGNTIQLEYIPSGDVSFIEGTGDLLSATSFKLDDPAEDATFAGTLDFRDAAYAGYVLRVIHGTGGSVDEHIISSWDRNNFTATLTRTTGIEAGSPLADRTYEIFPIHGRLVMPTLGMLCARTILMREGSEKRYKLMTQEYREKNRALRILLMRKESRRADRFEGDTVENRSFRSAWHLGGAGR